MASFIENRIKSYQNFLMIIIFVIVIGFIQITSGSKNSGEFRFSCVLLTLIGLKIVNIFQ